MGTNLERSDYFVLFFLHCGDQIVVLTISKTGKDDAAMGLCFNEMLRDFNSFWI